MPVNGKRYDWESITTLTISGVVVDYEGIDYSDKREVTSVHGKGSKPRGFGEGNYTAEGKTSLLKEEWLKLEAALAITSPNQAVYTHKPFPITVKYKNNDQPVPQVDVLRGVKLTGISDSRKQGDAKSVVELTFNITGGILRNGVEPV
jgi:hypothetical protein